MGWGRETDRDHQGKELAEKGKKEMAFVLRDQGKKRAAGKIVETEVITNPHSYSNNTVIY